ncbi:Nrd1 complex RNA-binding subunit [Cichlidogyrus casuarinus]|uniref:Nrd1 complex RNA-binding subunit n=1 Tax=Cichlidogyrus casuarinus TaxID=1844966 RepID=A0ABD2QAH2_9PLAT
MGSQKYPNENDFEDFISKRGGSTNAYTQNEMTMFYFDINAANFFEGFDRFINFFVHPLLKTDAIDREINAVDNDSLDELEDMVRKSCAPIYCNKTSEPVHFDHADPFDTPKFKGILKCYPIKDCEIIDITWALPSQRQYLEYARFFGLF